MSRIPVLERPRTVTRRRAFAETDLAGAERLRISGQMLRNGLATDTAEARAGGISRVLNPMLSRSTPVLRHVPVVGLAITAAGIGYHIHNGKPAGQAVVSGVAGFAASVAVGAAIGDGASAVADGAREVWDSIF